MFYFRVFYYNITTITNMIYYFSFILFSRYTHEIII
nr:MAG TPA: hypothetical protein [Caudoviricetes sp.]